MKKFFSMVLRAGISVLLLVFLFRKVDFKATLNVILTVRAGYLLLAAFAFFVLNMLGLYRWQMLLRAQSILIPFSKLLSAYCGGMFFSLFLPSTIGGDIARSVDLGSYTQRRSVIVASVLLDRLSGFVGLVIVAIISLLFGYRLVNEPAVYFVVLSLAGVLSTVLLLVFNKKLYARVNGSKHTKEGGIKESFKKLHSEIYFFRSKPHVLVLNLLCSVMIQSGCSLSAYFILRSLSVNIRVIYPLILNPVIVAISTLPISIGGLGLRDASSVFFYAKVGVTKDAAFALSLLNFVLILIFGLIAGIIYVSTLHYRRLQSHKADARS